MTDKEEIIIDGVDVSQCSKYATNEEFNLEKAKGKNLCLICEGIDCDYKQLAHKTQIIDEVEEVIKPYQEQIELDALSLPIAIESILERKTQECEELKAEEKYLKQCCEKAGEELAKHSFDYDGKEKNLVVQAIELNEKYEKLKKALEEIEKVCIENTWIFADGTAIRSDSLDDILNIINKTKGENNEQ